MGMPYIPQLPDLLSTLTVLTFAEVIPHVHLRCRAFTSGDSENQKKANARHVPGRRGESSELVPFRTFQV